MITFIFFLFLYNTNTFGAANPCQLSITEDYSRCAIESTESNQYRSLMQNHLDQHFIITKDNAFRAAQTLEHLLKHLALRSKFMIFSLKELSAPLKVSKHEKQIGRYRKVEIWLSEQRIFHEKIITLVPHKPNSISAASTGRHKRFR